MNKSPLASLCAGLSLLALFAVSCGTTTRNFKQGAGSGGEGDMATFGGRSGAGDGVAGADATMSSAGTGAVSVGGDDAGGNSGTAGSGASSGGAEVPACTAAQKLCGGVCVDINDPTYGCGPATCDASSCPSQGTGGTVACEGTACVIGACPSGYKKCNNKCVAISDPAYGCGATTCDASSCPAAGTGTLVCQNSACVIGTCGAGTKKCGSNCVTADANYGCADATRCTACANNEACSGTPTTCQCVPMPMATVCAGKCGSVSNGCGGMYTCGTCGGSTPNCVSNKCVCTPTPMFTACSGKSCGTVSDGCTGTYTCGTCNGTIPACKNGTSCVECTADANCTPLGYKTCDQTHNSCVCAQKNSGNRITDGGFDNSFLPAWGWDAMVVKWDSSDVDNCPRSGSVKIGSGSPNSGELTQCISVGNAGGKLFTLGFKYKQDTPNAVLCLVEFTTDPNCTAYAGPGFFGLSSGVGVSTTNWQSVSGSTMTDPGTSYISLQCKAQNGGTVWLDQMYLTQGSSGSFGL